MIRHNSNISMVIRLTSMRSTLIVLFLKAALAALAGSQLRTSNQSRNQPATNQQSHEMTVPNELIGCIIGKVT